MNLVQPFAMSLPKIGGAFVVHLNRKTPLEVSPTGFSRDSYRTQTCNLLIRSQMLYSIELRSQLPSEAYSLSAAL